jgi:hypothetical protein
MVTHVTEFCWRFPHNVINATKGVNGGACIGYALEESLGAYRNLIETLLGQLESSRSCFRSLRQGNRSSFRTSPLERYLVATEH